MPKQNNLRALPSVEQLLSSGSLDNEITELSRPVVADVVREVLQKTRASAKSRSGPQSVEQITLEVKSALHDLSRLRLRKVINGTGVLIHTNLGRAPIGEKLLSTVARSCAGYSTLEFDLATGTRGKRGKFLGYLLATLASSEDALAVNNNAAALFLILNTFANRREVIVSRAELVQIGGGFRIPDIIRKAGAKLVEVGTTNQTTKKDYEEAISSKTAILLKVHQSNFHIKGFVAEVTPNELAAIAAKHNLISVYDLGSGSVHQTKDYGMEAEPNITSAVRSKSSLVCFSGDKLFGSTQAGIILGDRISIEKLHRNPMYRTFRLDKLSLALLEAATLSYLRKTDAELLPLWRQIATSTEALLVRATAIHKKLAKTKLAVEIVKSKATPGGGSLPGGTLDSVALAITSATKANQFAKSLLNANPPLIGYIENERFMVDLRTVDPSEDADIIRILSESS